MKRKTMTRRTFNKILAKHEKWLNKEKGGERACLVNVDLSGIRSLDDVNLSGARIHKSNFEYASLVNAKFTGASIQEVNFGGAYLANSDFTKASISNSDFSGSVLVNANYKSASFYVCDFTRSNMRGVKFDNAYISYINLGGADLSGATGLISPIEFLNQNFEKTAEGYIAYKTFNAYFASPKHWLIEKGSIIRETIDFDRRFDCGSGINVAPLSWVKERACSKGGSCIWKVLIRNEWLPGVCVPYCTDGKIRCERVELIEIVK